MLADDLILLLMCIIDLTVEEKQFFFELLPFCNKECKFLFVVFTLVAEEHVGLYEFIALFL